MPFLPELLNFKEISRELYENIVTQNKDCYIESEKTKTIKKESQIIKSN